MGARRLSCCAIFHMPAPRDIYVAPRVGRVVGMCTICLGQGSRAVCSVRHATRFMKRSNKVHEKRKTPQNRAAAMGKGTRGNHARKRLYHTPARHAAHASNVDAHGFTPVLSTRYVTTALLNHILPRCRGVQGVCRLPPRANAFRPVRRCPHHWQAWGNEESAARPRADVDAARRLNQQKTERR